jgi:hypothetical protein
VLATPNADAGCAQCGAKLVAGRMPRQGTAGRGGCQRNAPTGGAAYGMLRYSFMLPAALPRTRPAAVRTTSEGRLLVGPVRTDTAPAAALLPFASAI